MKWFITRDEGGFRAAISRKEPTWSDSLALDDLVAWMDERRYRGEPVTLLLNGDSALSSALVYDRKTMGRDRQVLRFAMEERLPLAAEEFAVAFLFRKDAVLGIAVEVAEIKPVVDELEERGVLIGSIVPAAIQVASHKLEGKSPQRLIWKEAQAIDVVHWRDRTIASWQHLHSEADLEQERVFFPNGYEETIIEGESMLDAAIRHDVEPIINLRCDDLAAEDSLRLVRRSLQFFLVASLLLCLSIAGAFHVAAERYQAIAKMAIDEQEALFSEVFPSHPIPVGIMARLDGERRQLEGAAGNQDEVPQLSSALILFYDALSQLPELRFRLLEVRAEDGAIYIEGEARSHSDAEVIADSLRTSGLRVSTPSTENLPNGGVSMTINCVREST